MPFRFRLEVVQRVRERLLEAARMEMGAALARREELRRQVEMVRMEVARGQEELLREVSQGIMADEYRLRTQALARLRELLSAKEEELQAAEREVEEKRRRLEVRYRERELVERLRERHWRRYLEEEGRRIQAEMDDLVSMRRGGAAVTGGVEP